MNSVPAPMAATVVGMTAGAIIPGVATIDEAYGLTVRSLFWRGQKHAPKEKENDAGEYRQQDSEMYPTGLGHRNSPLFPRPGRQFNSTMWM